MVIYNVAWFLRLSTLNRLYLVWSHLKLPFLIFKEARCQLSRPQRKKSGRSDCSPWLWRGIWRITLFLIEGECLRLFLMWFVRISRYPFPPWLHSNELMRRSKRGENIDRCADIANNACWSDLLLLLIHDRNARGTVISRSSRRLGHTDSSSYEPLKARGGSKWAKRVNNHRLYCLVLLGDEWLALENEQERSFRYQPGMGKVELSYGADAVARENDFSTSH